MGDISPCEVIWNYEAPGAETAQYLSPYLGTVTLGMVDSVSDVQEEGYGDAPVDAVFAGTVITLSIPMARSTLTQLSVSIGYQDMGSLSGNVLTLKNVAGCDMYANARQIIIAPVCNNAPDPDPNTWILLYKCHPYRDFELTYDRSGQRVHMVRFKVFPNQDSGYCGVREVPWRSYGKKLSKIHQKLIAENTNYQLLTTLTGS